MVILLNASVEKLVRTIFPFDSGAYLNGRYDAWLPAHMPIDYFSLQTDPRRVRRFVKAFYGSNEAYWRMKVSAPSGNLSLRPVVDTLSEILSDVGIENADDRRLAVEMSLASPIPFRSEFVHSLIVPEEFVDALNEVKLTERTGIDVKPYILNPIRKASDHLGSLEVEAKAINASRSAFL
jgi:hypothetical protein